MKTVKLGEVAEINPRAPRHLAPETPVSFVPMASVSDTLGTIVSTEERPLGEVIKGYSSFARGDVLLAKITPCFENGKAACADIPHEWGFGSTEFHVMRPHLDKLSARYLLHFLRRDSIRREGERRMAGAGGQKRVPVSFLQELPIPLPSLSVQKRIAGILDAADALRAKRRRALARLDDLARSLFLHHFGDPVSNPRGWPVVTMGTLFQAPPIFGTMIPPVHGGGSWVSLRVANIQDWALSLADEKHVELPTDMIERHSVKDGDILMARAIGSQEHLGKCVVAYPGQRKWAFDSHLMRLRFDGQRTLPEFIRQLLMTEGGRSIFLKASRRSAVQFNINTKEVARLKIPLPPLSLQQQFARELAAVEAQKARQRAHLAKLDALFASLQSRAFTGGL